MVVFKRDGRKTIYDKNKIIKAIQKANNEMENERDRATMSEIKAIISIIESVYAADEAQGKKGISVEQIQDIIEKTLVEKFGRYQLAKEYILYRFKREIIRKANTTDESILSLVRTDNKEVMEENSNKDAYLNSTQRDLIAGEVSKDLTKRLLLPQDIVKAHEDGVLHFHDMDYFIQPSFNCCLVNIKDMLENGTVMNGKMIESPKSFQVACTITTQIIAAVASGQYGGQSVNVKHLGKYLYISHMKYLKKIRKEIESHEELYKFESEEDKEKAISIAAIDRLKDELKSGVQTIQYQLNTLMTTNGQSPFVTLFLHIDDNDKYEKYSAMIIEEIIDQRYEGIKNEKGVYITPAFPKLIYVLDENNIEGGKYNYITKKAARCTAKRLYPDYISAKKMRENYEGEVFSCMGCVSGNSVIRYKYKGKIYKESFLMMWNRLSNENEVIPQQIINGEKSPHKYMEVEDLYIYDTEKGYVKVKRVIRNKAVSNWMEVRFNNGISIHCTEDHPFFTRNKGRIPAIELEKRDIMIYNENTDIEDETSKMMNIKVTDVNKIKGIYMDSFDVTTESDFFEVNGIYSHNCRSFLSPWKDENGEYKWEGRFNQGKQTMPRYIVICK